MKSDIAVRDIEVREEGFTLVEVIVVVAVIAILAAIASPSLISWRTSMQYKQAADGILAALRTTKSNTLSANIQNRFECNPAGNRYRIVQGNRAYNSNTWTTVIQDWSTLPTGVIVNDCSTTNDFNILFNPDGTAGTTATVCVKDTSTTKYQIRVWPTGRIQQVKQ